MAQKTAAKNEFLTIEPGKRPSDRQMERFKHICSTEFTVKRRAYLSVAPLLDSLTEHGSAALIIEYAVGKGTYIPRGDLIKMIRATPDKFKSYFFRRALVELRYSVDDILEELEKTIANSDEKIKADCIHVALQFDGNAGVNLFGARQLARLPGIQDGYNVSSTHDFDRKISMYQYALQVLEKHCYFGSELIETARSFQKERWPDMIKLLMKKKLPAKEMVAQLPKNELVLVLDFLGGLKNCVEEAEKEVRDIISMTKDYVGRIRQFSVEIPPLDIKQGVEKILYEIKSTKPHRSDEVGTLDFDFHFRDFKLDDELKKIVESAKRHLKEVIEPGLKTVEEMMAAASSRKEEIARESKP